MKGRKEGEKEGRKEGRRREGGKEEGYNEVSLYLPCQPHVPSFPFKQNIWLLFSFCSLSQSPQIQILSFIQGPAQVPLPRYHLPRWYLPFPNSRSTWWVPFLWHAWLQCCVTVIYHRTFLLKGILEDGLRPRCLHLTTWGHLKNHDRPLSLTLRDSDWRVWGGALESILLKASPGDSDPQPRLRTTNPIQPSYFTCGKTELHSCYMTRPQSHNGRHSHLVPRFSYLFNQI